MALVNIQDVILTFGGARLFDAINLTIERGEKVALVGRNGSGKSTLLKLISGIIRPDSGAVAIQKGTRPAYLDQMVPGEIPGSVLEAVRGELGRQPGALEEEEGWKVDQQVARSNLATGAGRRSCLQFPFAGFKASGVAGQGAGRRAGYPFAG